MSGDTPMGRGPGDDADGLGSGWLSDPGDTDELGAFLHGRIPPPQKGDYWEVIENQLASIAEDESESHKSFVSDEDLTHFLQSSIPAPSPSFWQNNEQRLAKIAAEQGFADSLDTEPSLVRPKAMDTTTAPTEIASIATRRSIIPRGAIVLAAAAALVLIAGLGVFALRSDSDGDSFELATQPEVSQTAAEGSGTTGAVVAPGESESTSGSANEGSASAEAGPAGPLTTMQLRLAGEPVGNDALFCFAADGVNVAPVAEPAENVVVQLSVQPNGSYSLLALQNDFYLMFAAGDGRDDGTFATSPLGISNLSPSLPPYQIALTDSAISFGPESTLPLVNCAEVEPQISIMMTAIEASRNRYSASVPVEGPLAAVQSRVNAPGTTEQSDAYCFAASGQAVVHMTVDANGLVSFAGIRSDGVLVRGSGAGSADGQIAATVIENPGGAEVEVPSTEVSVTQQSFSLSGDTLNLVPCAQVAFLVDLVLATQAGEPGQELAPIADEEVISSAGLGAVRIGMLVSELESDLGVDLEIVTLDGDEAGTCGSISSTIDRDVWIIVELTADGDAIVQRVSTQSSRWATPSGIRVGGTEQQVRDAFPGQLAEQQHVYVEDGEYLTFLPNDPNDPNTVQFVVESGVVTEIRAGSGPWVGLAEGCA